MNNRYVRVAVAIPIRKTFSYILPEQFSEKDYTGYAVLVPFGNQRTVGFILGYEEKVEEELELKPIMDILTEQPVFTKRMVKFYEWISEYYFYPIGQVILACIPPVNVSRYFTAKLTKKGKSAINELPDESKEKKALLWILKNPGKRVEFSISLLKELQQKRWITVRRGIKKKNRPFLRKFVKIKTHIDLDKLSDELSEEEKRLLSILEKEGLVAKLRKEIKNVYYVVRRLEKKGIIESFYVPVYADIGGSIIGPISVPEKLEPQQQAALSKITEALKENRFSSYLLFGVTGSGKTEVYLRATEMALSMGKQVIFMLPEISLAIYMESIFRARLGERIAIYHSRLSDGERYDQWMKIVKGDIDVVIGARSALFAPLPRLGLIIVDEEHDPSYKQDSFPYYQARDAAVMRAYLEDAVVVLGSGTPSVQSYYNALTKKYELIVMKKRVEKRPMPEIEIVDMRDEKPGTIFSKVLIKAIEENLKKKRQSILFLNKRGFYRVYICQRCGRPIRCPNCEVSLVYHLRENRLKCHYCGYYTEEPEKCSFCDGMVFKAIGYGTERVEKELADLFPQARIKRMDTDSMRRKGAVSVVLRQFINGEIDILVGTQMVTKGYHFPRVTLVGVINADVSLLFPDFRASEWTYQLLSQVSGRAGREKEKGKVIIQTFNPSHYSIQAALRHNYLMFFNKERKLRMALKYPPYSHIVCLKFFGNKKEETIKLAYHVAGLIKEIIEKRAINDKVEVLGPIEAPISKIKGKFRWQIILKSKRPYLHVHILTELENNLDKVLKSTSVRLIWDVDPYYMV